MVLYDDCTSGDFCFKFLLFIWIRPPRSKIICSLDIKFHLRHFSIFQLKIQFPISIDRFNFLTSLELFFQFFFQFYKSKKVLNNLLSTQYVLLLSSNKFLLNFLINLNYTVLIKVLFSNKKKVLNNFYLLNKLQENSGKKVLKTVLSRL